MVLQIPSIYLFWNLFRLDACICLVQTHTHQSNHRNSTTDDLLEMQLDRIHLTVHAYPPGTIDKKCAGVYCFPVYNEISILLNLVRVIVLAKSRLVTGTGVCSTPFIKWVPTKLQLLVLMMELLITVIRPAVKFIEEQLNEQGTFKCIYARR